MRVTVCELSDERAAFEEEWRRLVRHVRDFASQLVLLPDMPFCRWFADSLPDAAVWIAAVRAHDEWEHNLPELAPALVLGSRPVDFGNERYDGGFVWDIEHGMRSVHAKSRTAEAERGEKSWYHSAAPEFVPLEVHGARVGFLIGGEVWAEDEARRYGQEGVNLLAMPRSAATPVFEEWLARACHAASLAGAYALSSNRSGAFGGQGWIIAPDGRVLGLTSASQPFLSLDLELPMERAGAPELQPQEAPRWIDPLETGVPPYS